ncbi:type I 3-dehydroquinate dehydratase [Tissierella creatinini]|nr:type I 3-dehydroquinate dehydratase [Tissierella creatinini]TJX63905.1 type I 3-dehydroquinate dehydratase [Soehngenia saccharolytica]
MKVINLKDIRIGEGMPKIIVPIVENTSEDIIKKALSLKGMGFDIVEWRVDFYEDPLNLPEIIDILRKLRYELDTRPLIFTFRSKSEGGEKTISDKEYTALNKAAAESGYADIVDVEIFMNEDVAKENIKNIHKAGVLVIGSNHDFNKTPDKDEIVSRLRKMQEMDADIPKIAVMPNSEEDVLTLLSATNEMHTKYADRPIITMAMGPLGVISRLSGELFGSSMTFGSVGRVSAPGQVPVEELKQALQIVHDALE